MLLVLDNNIHLQQVNQLIERLQWMGFQVVQDKNEAGLITLALVNSHNATMKESAFTDLPGVVDVQSMDKAFKLASSDYKSTPSVIHYRGLDIGGDGVVIISGSCSVESEQQIMETARLVSAQGATILRGGAYKPRTSPYDFQGLGEIGLQYLQQAAQAHNMLTVSEVMDTADIDLVAQHIDILQVGARNMQNYSLLKQLGRVNQPVLLKRGFAATYKEFLLAAEYILSSGNPNVILCERGIRTFENFTRNTLDIGAVPVLHELSHLPVIVDPSHGIGIRRMVPAMARAAVAAGADGLVMEAHPDPDNALSDSQQTISPDTLGEVMSSLEPIAQSIGRFMLLKANQ